MRAHQGTLRMQEARCGLYPLQFDGGTSKSNSSYISRLEFDKGHAHVNC